MPNEVGPDGLTDQMRNLLDEILPERRTKRLMNDIFRGPMGNPLFEDIFGKKDKDA